MAYNCIVPVYPTGARPYGTLAHIMPHPPIALYIHIPFCQTKCSYCNFNTYARLDGLIPQYVPALAAEIAAWGEALVCPPVDTVFFGGGTPSWIDPHLLAQVLDAARRSFAVQDHAEITIEANPGDFTPERLASWRSMGVNRLSMGVQSFDDAMLLFLTRRHTAADAVAAYRRARQAGFDNISLDLIYGLPNQTQAQWRDGLGQALDLAPEHLSLYALTVEEGTPLHGQVQAGQAPAADPDAAADMYLAAEEFLAQAGYRHYEISNWARPGCESRHNLAYWRNAPFLGVGPGAHSYLGGHLGGQRFWNIKSPTDYVRRMQQPHAGRWTPQAVPVVEERSALSDEDRLSETAILALRLDDGVSLTALESAFGTSAQRIAATLRMLAPAGLVTEDAGVYRLTSKGRLLSNEVFVRLLPA